MLGWRGKKGGGKGSWPIKIYVCIIAGSGQ